MKGKVLLVVLAAILLLSASSGQEVHLVGMTPHSVQAGVKTTLDFDGTQSITITKSDWYTIGITAMIGGLQPGDSAEMWLNINGREPFNPLARVTGLQGRMWDSALTATYRRYLEAGDVIEVHFVSSVPVTVYYPSIWLTP